MGNQQQNGYNFPDMQNMRHQAHNSQNPYSYEQYYSRLSQPQTSSKTLPFTPPQPQQHRESSSRAPPQNPSSYHPVSTPPQTSRPSFSSKVQQIDKIKVGVKLTRDKVNRLISLYQIQIEGINYELTREKETGLSNKKKAVYLLKQRKEFETQIVNLENRKQVVLKTLNDLNQQHLDREMIIVLEQSNNYMRVVQEELERMDWRGILADVAENRYSNQLMVEAEADEQVEQMYLKMEREVMGSRILDTVKKIDFEAIRPEVVAVMEIKKSQIKQELKETTDLLTSLYIRPVVSVPLTASNESLNSVTIPIGGNTQGYNLNSSGDMGFEIPIPTPLGGDYIPMTSIMVETEEEGRSVFVKKGSMGLGEEKGVVIEEQKMGEVVQPVLVAPVIIPPVSPVVPQMPPMQNKSPQIINQNPQIINQKSQMVNQNPQIVNQIPQIVNQNPQTINQNTHFRGSNASQSNQAPQLIHQQTSQNTNRAPNPQQIPPSYNNPPQSQPVTMNSRNNYPQNIQPQMVQQPGINIMRPLSREGVQNRPTSQQKIISVPAQGQYSNQPQYVPQPQKPFIPPPPQTPTNLTSRGQLPPPQISQTPPLMLNGQFPTLTRQNSNSGSRPPQYLPPQYR